MSGINDFEIENGILKKYNGTDAHITIPDGVTVIGKNAFYLCISLKELTIPDSVTVIGMGAFAGCESLTDLTIPDSVTEIGKYAFFGCSQLTVHIRAGSYAEKYAKENNVVFVTE